MAELVIAEDISDEEFELAKADALRRWGVMPPSLQRVIDRGGRFGFVIPRQP